MSEPAGAISTDSVTLDQLGDGAISAPPEYTAPDELIEELHARLAEASVDWKSAVLDTISQWPVAAESVNGDQLVYLIGGEAFDWRLLAERLTEGAEVRPPEDEWREWLLMPDMFAGYQEAEFTRLLGVDKFRAHLSYFYGVTVEQALFVATQEEVVKRRVASGREPTDHHCDEAYPRLYGDDQEVLWARFSTECDIAPARPGRRHVDEHALADSEAFTYWLFKLRLEKADPARVASDTRKGLAQLERMRQAHEKRQNWLRRERLGQ